MTAKVAALRGCQLRRLLGAELASTVGNFAVLAALPFAVLSIGGTLGQAGLALGCQAIAFGLVLLAAGTAGDRLPRRTILVGADLLRFVAQAAVAVLLLMGTAAFWQLVVAQAALGVGMAFFMPAMTALLPEVVPGDSLQDANALRGIVASVGGILGPALAGVLLAAADPGWAFAADALSFLASAALLTGLRLPAAPQRGGSPLLGDLIEGWAEFRRRTWAWAVVLEVGLLNALVFAPFFVLGPGVAEESLGGSAAWAAILAAMGLGELAGGLFALYWRPPRPLLAALLAMGLWVLPLLLLAAAAPIGLIVLGAAAAGASLAVFAALWQTVLQLRIPAELRSRISSYDLLGSFALLPLGYMLGGFVEASIGAAPGLIAGAAILAACTAAVVAVPSVRAVAFDPVGPELLGDVYRTFTPPRNTGATLFSTTTPERKGDTMPQLMIATDRHGEDAGTVVYRERVSLSDLESDHFSGQLVERVGWALHDADEIEHDANKLPHEPVADAPPGSD
jgi:MFS family permease